MAGQPEGWSPRSALPASKPGRSSMCEPIPARLRIPQLGGVGMGWHHVVGERKHGRRPKPFGGNSAWLGVFGLRFPRQPWARLSNSAARSARPHGVPRARLSGPPGTQALASTPTSRGRSAWRRRSELSGCSWGLAKARAGISMAASRADGTADRRSPTTSSNDRRCPGCSSPEAPTTTSVHARSRGHPGRGRGSVA